MSLPIASLDVMWEQVRQVRSRLTGGPWHQTFTGPVPLPVWLVDLANEHIDMYVGPDPVLFRTAGIGLDWFIAAQDHPDHLEVTCAHGVVDDTDLRTAVDVLADTGAVVDVDAYVWGDGHPDGRFAVRIHTLFGVFTGQGSPRELDEQLDVLRGRFIITVRATATGQVVQLVPRLREAA